MRVVKALFGSPAKRWGNWNSARSEQVFLWWEWNIYWWLYTVAMAIFTATLTLLIGKHALWKSSYRGFPTDVVGSSSVCCMLCGKGLMDAFHHQAALWWQWQEVMWTAAHCAGCRKWSYRCFLLPSSPLQWTELMWTAVNCATCSVKKVLCMISTIKLPSDGSDKN